MVTNWQVRSKFVRLLRSLLDNDRLVKDSSSFVHNATLLWKEIFEDESRWPSVVYMSVSGICVGIARFRVLTYPHLLKTAYSSNKRQQQHFLFDHHVKAFVQSLPKTWLGTLVLGDVSVRLRVSLLRTDLNPFVHSISRENLLADRSRSTICIRSTFVISTDMYSS